MTRLLAQGPDALRQATTLLDPAELADAQAALASTLATADLLGRARVRIRQRKVEAKVRTFADQPTTFADVIPNPRDLRPLPPEAALAYFTGLLPELGTDPRRFADTMERRAFTVATATDLVLLKRVKAVIANALETGRGGTPDIQDILDGAGVSARSPQYAEMIFRTSMMDSYTTGTSRELREPDVAEAFPVWRYAGIKDGRQGADHEPKFGRYYPSSAPFAEVRGPRPFNCRCVQLPVDKFEWADLQARGITVETDW